jgi:hypothetical protein
VSRTVTIPLTDKLPDRDGSLDMMFFTGNDALPQDNPRQDTTLWHIESMHAHISPAAPTLAALKDYVRRFVTREVPV